jgi:hypothetical protein
MSNNNLANISTFENLQNQANQSMGLQSSMSVFNADPKTITALKKEGKEITKKVSALGDELITFVKTQKLNRGELYGTLMEYKRRFLNLREQYNNDITKKYDAKNDKDLESIFTKDYFNLEQIFYTKTDQAKRENAKNSGF